MKTSLVVRAPSGCQEYLSWGNFSASATTWPSAASMARMSSALIPAGAAGGWAWRRAAGTASEAARVAATRTFVALCMVSSGAPAGTSRQARICRRDSPFTSKAPLVYRAASPGAQPLRFAGMACRGEWLRHGEILKTGKTYRLEMSWDPQLKQANRANVVAFGETLRLAMDTLRVHKLRTFLTLLGVILSVFTLVLVMSVVAGLNRYVSDKLANLGANSVIFTRFGIITNFEDFVKAQRRPPLRVDDYEYVRDHAQLPRQVGASASRQL